MSNEENKELDLPFELNLAERISPLWIKISTQLEKRLAELRTKNDNETLSEGETAALRGQIKFCKAVIGLGNEPPPLDE